MDKSNQQNFSIGDAETLTGVSQRCLRAIDGTVPDRIVFSSTTSFFSLAA